MWPVLLAPPTVPFTVQAYPVVLALTVVLGTSVALLVARRVDGLGSRQVLGALLLLSLAGLFGARLHFRLAHGSDGPGGGPFWAVWDGGLHAAGGILGLMVTLPLIARWCCLPLRAFADVVAVAGAFAMGLYRIGCLLRGCCIGHLCRYPWCLPYPRTSYAFFLHANEGVVAPDAAFSAPVHPLPLYYLAVAWSLAACGVWLLPRRRYVGEVAMLTVFGFTAAMVILEPFRAVTPDTVFWGGRPQLLVAAVLLALATGLLLVITGWLARRAPAGEHT
jgi:phosphatidylglycerol:prolipoprotein diacylglycerol transferase